MFPFLQSLKIKKVIFMTWVNSWQNAFKTSIICSTRLLSCFSHCCIWLLTSARPSKTSRLCKSVFHASATIFATHLAWRSALFQLLRLRIEPTNLLMCTQAGYYSAQEMKHREINAVSRIVCCIKRGLEYQTPDEEAPWRIQARIAWIVTNKVEILNMTKFADSCVEYWLLEA